jgi:hypothetical protein
MSVRLSADVIPAIQGASVPIAPRYGDMTKPVADRSTT